jgi:hypothetical protein
MTNNPFLLALIIRNLLRQLFPKKPEYVESRAEARQNFQQTIVQPFKEGYPGTPAQKRLVPRKPVRLWVILLTIIILSMILSRR